MLAVGLFVGFDELTALFSDGSFRQSVFALLSLAFQLITALSALYFVYMLLRALTETANDQSFSFSAVTQGLVFSFLPSPR